MTISHRTLVDRIFSTMLRGNEIEFKYQDKAYFLLPCWENKTVYAVCLGRAQTENEVVCASSDELYRAMLDGWTFGEIVSEINVIFCALSW